MPVAALPPEVTDAVTIVTGLSMLGGVGAWIGWLIGRAIFESQGEVEHWVIQGAGIGGSIGLVLALVYLAA